MVPAAPRSQTSRTFQEFVGTEAAAGMILLLCAAGALIVANSPWSDSYHRLWASAFVIRLGGHAFSLTFHQWINDGLMAIFFLLVGLEIKRELIAGELASPRQAALPILAAGGGMIVPACVFYLTSSSGPMVRGWAIPMATDIAFAIGVLALIAPRAPAGLKIFLAALAIVDDLGAVLVIAFFYTSAISWVSLSIVTILFAVLVSLNRLGVQRLAAYLIVGVGLWLFMLDSGVHATISGILLAVTIPTSGPVDARSDGTKQAGTGPLERLEHALQTFCAFVVMPLFAFANAGVVLDAASTGRVTLAVGLGLTLGKPLGITAASVAAVRMKLAVLPNDVGWMALHGCAWLAGIGFTMSLFIATLAFEGTVLLDAAKVGILAGSALAGAVGATLLRVGLRGAPAA
jgi:NhaA family Na+:H+ antiporter